MGIGKNLKIALGEVGLTVAELSRKTGISTNTFYSMIRRDNEKISPDVLKKICENTDITVYDLIDDYDEFIAKYFAPNATKEEKEVGDYVSRIVKNDVNLEDMIRAYNLLNDIGKSVAHERITELLEIPKYRKDTK